MGLDPLQLKLNPQLLAFYRSGLRYLYQPHGNGEQSQQEWTQANSNPRDEWLQWLQALNPPYKVVLTYQKLCFDRGADPGEASRQRRELFANMLFHLAWPEQDYAFWPHSLFREEDTVADSDLFWQGIQLLKPEYVLVFGEQAADTLFPDRVAGTEEIDLEGVRYMILPDPDEMLPDNRSAKKRVWNKLKTLPVAA
jgi:uracil-DNA glycosylase